MKRRGLTFVHPNGAILTEQGARNPAVFRCLVMAYRIARERRRRARTPAQVAQLEEAMRSITESIGLA